MKILLVNSPFQGGGITAYSSELINCLSQSYKLVVILPDDSIRPITAQGVDVIYHDTMELSKRNALFFIKLINETIKPDVVISSFGLIVPVIAPFLNNNILLLTVSHSGKFFNSDYCALNNKYIDTIIAASSNYNKKYLEKKFGIHDSKKVRVIYNFLRHDESLESYRHDKKTTTPITILYSGGNLSGKNPDLVIRMLCDLVRTKIDFKFYWIGKTNILPKNRFFYHFKPNDVRQFLPPDERVVFKERISSKEEFNCLLANSNVLLAPSRNEGCSMLLLEALRTGTICLVGDYRHGSREIVENGNCGFVLNHHQPKECSDLLKDIITTPEAYNQQYDNAYDSFVSTFTYPIWKQSIEEVLSSELNHKRRLEKISNARLFFYIWKMKILKRESVVNRFFQLTIKSLFMFYYYYYCLKLQKIVSKVQIYL